MLRRFVDIGEEQALLWPTPEQRTATAWGGMTLSSRPLIK